MSLAQTAYGFAIGKRARFVLSIIKQKNTHRFVLPKSILLGG